MARKLLNHKIGDVVNDWTIIDIIKDKWGHKIYVVRCKCGAIREKGGNALHKQVSCIACKNRAVFTTHNLSNNNLYYRFKDMHSRCYYTKHKKYPVYGARGIKVCKEWEDTPEGLQNFVSWAESHGFRKDLVLDRVDSDGDYCPENCRYVTVTMNNFNRRTTKGYRFHNGVYEAYIGVKGKTITIGQYKTEQEAINARKQAELKYYGENTKRYRD